MNAMGHALWSPNPTGTSDIKARQLAWALGYPSSWRVVRTVEEIPCIAAGDTSSSSSNSSCESNLCIVDRIYAGKPGTGCDMWFNHSAAMLALPNWDATKKNPFQFQGGHLLPKKPLFQKGDKVQVLFKEDNQWYPAKIVLVKKHQKDGTATEFRYQVFYPLDKSKQNGIPEEFIRPDTTTTPITPKDEDDPSHHQMAVDMGLGPDWKAIPLPNRRGGWKIVDPQGQVYSRKKAALDAYRGPMSISAKGKKIKNGVVVVVDDAGDPPWRLDGHEYLGRTVSWSRSLAVTARRTITVEQIGRVAAWISDTDVDRAGRPGFVSDVTGQPAKLFRVVFDSEPHFHPYPQHLVLSQDLEESELLPCLVTDDPPKSSSSSRKRALPHH